MIHTSTRANACAHVAAYYEMEGDVYCTIAETLGYPVSHIMVRAYDLALSYYLAAWTPYNEAALDAFAAAEIRSVGLARRKPRTSVENT